MRSERYFRLLDTLAGAAEAAAGKLPQPLPIAGQASAVAEGREGAAAPPGR